MTPLLLVFLKAPRAGLVKTRLARQVGDDEARRIYRQLAERQLTDLPAGWPVEIRFAPDDAGDEMRSWLGPRFSYRPQGEGDLGARLERAFAEGFRTGQRAVIAIGADCPELGAPTLSAAAQWLDSADGVLGPARDGGYYLIGLRRYAPRLFEDIAWSSPTVLRTTLQRAAEARLSVMMLEEKEDVDDLPSWRRCAAGRSKSSTGWPRVGVVIPALDEAERIGACLAAVRANFPGAPVVVVDGGSRDETAARATDAGAAVVHAARGRGLQCRAGAAAVRAEWLLFLHADTLLPSNAAQVVAAFVARPAARIATFRLQFDHADWFLRSCGWCTRFDSVFTRFGDQGILIRRDFYAELGGFPEWPLFEDVALLQRARRRTRVHSLPAAVTTSARRFERRGRLRQQWLNARLLLRYLCGASPEALAESYRAGAIRASTGLSSAAAAGAKPSALSPP